VVARSRTRRSERGVAFTEFALIFPIFLLIFLSSIDIGRLIYIRQVIANLSREGASLASRGSTDAQAIGAIEAADDPLDLAKYGKVIVSTISRRSPADGTPWVTNQTVDGTFAFNSRVGTVGAKATVPGVASLAAGITIRTVEVATPFKPVMSSTGFGVVYPSFVYEVSYF
jgi:Flp pilus assembly protein TadG